MSAPIVERLHNPLFVASLHSRVALILGIVLLMTSKPDLTGSLLIVVISLVIGLASALPAWGRPRRRHRFV